MMTLRPAMLEAFWAGGHTSPGSGNPDKPLRIYPDFATARGRYKLSPPQQVGEPFLFDYMAYHSLRRVEGGRSEEHTSELQSLMRISYAVFCLKKKKSKTQQSYTKKTHTQPNKSY